MCGIILNDEDANQHFENKSETLQFFDRDFKDIIMIKDKIEKESKQNMDDKNLLIYINNQQDHIREKLKSRLMIMDNDLSKSQIISLEES